MKKVRYKKRYKKSNMIILIVTMISICVFLVFKIINKRVGPIFMNVAESETKKFATLVINDAVNNKISDESFENLIKTTSDSNDNITSLEFNTATVNKLLTLITNSVLLNLKYIEEGNIDSLDVSDEIFDSYSEKNLEKGIIYRIPMSVLFNNSLLNNIGPKVPVKLNFMGNIDSNIKTKTKNYGINNALVEVYINLKVTIEVVLPMISKKTTVNTSVPVVMKVIQGTVPEFYSSGSNPSISVPIS